MDDLTRLLLDRDDRRSGQVVYGVASGDNTVAVRGAATAVELPALVPVKSGDYCAVWESGADRLILGPVGGTQYGEESGTTDGSGELSVTFPTPFAATPVVVATTRTSLDRFVVIRAISTTGFTVAYYDLSAGALATSASIIVDWIAHG